MRDTEPRQPETASAEKAISLWTSPGNRLTPAPCGTGTHAARLTDNLTHHLQAQRCIGGKRLVQRDVEQRVKILNRDLLVCASFSARPRNRTPPLSKIRTGQSRFLAIIDDRARDLLAPVATHECVGTAIEHFSDGASSVLSVSVAKQLVLERLSLRKALAETVAESIASKYCRRSGCCG